MPQQANPKPAQLERMLQEFLAQSSSAAVLENGEEIFAFAEGADSARYNVSGDDAKCLLHLWSTERNVVRRVLAAEIKKDSVLLSVQRFGQAKPARLELIRERDRRLPAARKQARLAYARMLERAMVRAFPDLKASPFTTAMDLERSFGPAYARGTLGRGRSRFAVLGVGSSETLATIDGSLTLALLWLAHLRQQATHEVVEGVRLVVPAGSSATVRERMACLDRAAAKFELYEFQEREQELSPIDCSDRGNVQTHLVRACDPRRTRDRLAPAIAKVLALTPEPMRVEVRCETPAEASFRLHGLQFARARLAGAGLAGSLLEISFGAGAHEVVLTEENQSARAALVQELFRVRRQDGDRAHPLWRMQPERWLESLAAKDISALDAGLDPAHVYSQVPAFSASDRGVIDLLAATNGRRLTVIELKADEDLHLPLQGLDYWARVAWHHERGELQAHGYFPERELLPQAPRLLLVAPALHIHPATDTLLQFFSPALEWEFVALDERWREGLRVAFRKGRKSAGAAQGT